MCKDFSLNYLPTSTENNWKDKIEEIVSFSYSELEERINTMNSTRPYLTDMDAAAKTIGAVNVVKNVEKH